MMNISIKQICLNFFVALTCLSGSAQTITIHLLDAKSGKPMVGQNVPIKWDKDFQSLEVSVSKTGVATVQVPNGAKTFLLLPGPRKSGEPNRIAYQNCNGQGSALLSVADVLRQGIVPQNTCGHAHVDAHPGEVIFWARPRPFLDFQ